MIYLFLAEGFEEVEAVTPLDYLRRAGLNVVSVGVNTKEIKGAHGISVLSDIADFETVYNDELEGIILPGGMPGTLNLEKSDIVQRAIDFCAENNRLIAAICAAPSILGHKNLLSGLEATCYPGVEKECYGAQLAQKPVCCDKNFITAMSAGTATQFSAKIIEYFRGANVSKKVLEDVRWKG